MTNQEGKKTRETLLEMSWQDVCSKVSSKADKTRIQNLQKHKNVIGITCDILCLISSELYSLWTKLRSNAFKTLIWCRRPFDFVSSSSNLFNLCSPTSASFCGDMRLSYYSATFPRLPLPSVTPTTSAWLVLHQKLSCKRFCRRTHRFFFLFSTSLYDIESQFHVDLIRQPCSFNNPNRRGKLDLQEGKSVHPLSCTCSHDIAFLQQKETTPSLRDCKFTCDFLTALKFSTASPVQPHFSFSTTFKLLMLWRADLRQLYCETWAE